MQHSELGKLSAFNTGSTFSSHLSAFVSFLPLTPPAMTGDLTLIRSTNQLLLLSCRAVRCSAVGERTRRASELPVLSRRGDAPHGGLHAGLPGVSHDDGSWSRLEFAFCSPRQFSGVLTKHGRSAITQGLALQGACLCSGFLFFSCSVCGIGGYEVYPADVARPFSVENGWRCAKWRRRWIIAPLFPREIHLPKTLMCHKPSPMPLFAYLHF